MRVFKANVFCLQRLELCAGNKYIAKLGKGAC